MLVRAAALLAAVRVGLALLPLRTVQRAVAALARRGAEAEGTREGDACVDRAVRRASRVVRGSTCLPQALAGLVLMGLRGEQSRVHIGVRRQADEPFGAHAWLETPRGVTIGGEQATDFALLLTIDPFRAEETHPR